MCKMNKPIPGWFAISLLILACSGRENQKTPSTPSEYPDQESWNSTVILTSAGKLNAIIHYRHMRRFSQKGIAKFDQGVKVHFYDEEGKRIFVLTSDKGLLDERTNDVEAFGRVVVVSDKGITLRTKRLRWDEHNQRIISDDLVTITTEKDTLYGVGFESDRHLENWVIKKPWGVSQRKAILEKKKELME